MTGMTLERLAEIRRRTRRHIEILGMAGVEEDDIPFDWQARAELVAEVDRLRAIEAGVEALADEWRSSLNPPAGAGMEAFVVSEWAGCLRANLPALDALLNPTEGETDEPA